MRPHVFQSSKPELAGEDPVDYPSVRQRDDHAQGLLHLLTLAARVLAPGDYTAKTTLALANEPLSGIYPGNPKRSTLTATTERLLQAFGNLHLIVNTADRCVTTNWRRFHPCKSAFWPSWAYPRRSTPTCKLADLEKSLPIAGLLNV